MNLEKDWKESGKNLEFFGNGRRCNSFDLNKIRRAICKLRQNPAYLKNMFIVEGISYI